MINLIIPALLLGANTLAQSPGTFTMNVTTHSTGAPGSGCIILAQIATLSAPNTITAMKPICPPTAPNPSTQGGEVIPWPLSADGDGAASDLAIYGNLPGGDGDTWKPGCVMMVNQRQVSYLLGRNLEWISDTGQVLDMTGGGYLLDTENNYARMICQSHHPYMAGDLNLPSPNTYKPDDSKWWTALTVPGLGEGEWPSPPPPSSDTTQPGGSETSSVYSEGPSPTTSFRFIDTATAETSPSEVTGDPTSIQDPTLIISAQPSELASSASELFSEIPSNTTAILTGIESQQSELPESSSISSSIVSTAATEAQASPTDVPAVSSIIIDSSAMTSDPVPSSASDVVEESSNNTNLAQQTSPAITADLPTTIPVIASDAPAPVTSNGTNTSVTTEETTMIFSQASSTPINGVTTAEPIPIISTAGELTSNIIANPTILNPPSTVPVPTSSPDAGTPVPSAGAQNTSSIPTFEAGQTEVAAPTRQVPNQIPSSAVSSPVTSSPSPSNISNIESSQAVESTALPIKVPVVVTSPVVQITTPAVESPAFTAIVGEPKVTTLTPDQEGAGGEETSVGAPSQVSQVDSSAGPVITLATVAKGKTTAGVTGGGNTAVEDVTDDTSGDSALASSYLSSSSSSSSSSSAYEELITSVPDVTSPLPTSILPSMVSNESSLVSGVTAIPVPSDGTVLASTGGYSTLPASTLDPSAHSPESPPIPEPTPAVIADKGAIVEPKKSVLRLTTTIYANLTQPTTTSISSISPMCCSDVLSVSERDLTTITVVSTTTCIPCPSSTGMTAQSTAQITAAIETAAAGSLEAGSALAHTDLPLGDEASAVTSDVSVVESSAQTVPSDGMSTIDSGPIAQPEATDALENISDATGIPSSSSPTSDIEVRADPTSPPAPSPPAAEASPPPAPEASPPPAPESSPPPAAEAAPSPDSEASPPPAPEAPPAPTATLDVPTFETTDPFRELGFFPFTASLRLKQRQRGRGGPGGQGGQGGQGGNWGGGGDHQGEWTGGQPAQPAPADTVAAAANVEPAAVSAAYVAPAAVAAVTEPAAASAADVNSQYTQPAPVSDYESMYAPDQAAVQDGSPANDYGSVWSSVVPKTGNVASGTGASTIDRETLASPTSTIPSITSSETPSTAAISSVAPTSRVTSSIDSSSIGFSDAANGTEDSSAEDAAEDGEVDETNGNDDGEDVGVDGDPTITIDDGSTGSTGSEATSLSGQVTSLLSSVLARPSSIAGSSRESTSDQSSGSTGSSDDTSIRVSPTISPASTASRATSIMSSSSDVSTPERDNSDLPSILAESQLSTLGTQVMSQVESTGQTSLRPSPSSDQSSGMESSSVTSSSSATSSSSSSSRISQYTASPVSMANTVPISSIPTSLETNRPTTVPISSSTPSVISTSERSTASPSSQVITSRLSSPEAETSEAKTSEVKASEVKTSEVKPTEAETTEAKTLQEQPPPSTSPASTAQTTSSKMTSPQGFTTQQPSSPSPTELSSAQPTTAPFISSFMPTSQQPPSSSPEQSSFQPTTTPIVSSQVTTPQSPSSSPEQSSFQPATTPIVSSQVTTPQTPSSSPEQSTVEPTTSPSTSFQGPTTAQAPSPSSEQSTAEPTTFQEQTTDQPWSTQQPSPESTFEPSSQESSFEPPPPSSSEDAPPESPTAAPFEEPSSSPVFTDAGATIGQFLTSLLSNSNDPPADAGSGGGDDVTTIGQFTPTGDIPGLAQATQTLALVQRRGEVEEAKPTPELVAPHRRRSRLRRRIDRM